MFTVRQEEIFDGPQSPRGLRRRSAAARLLRLRVSNPTVGMDVSLLYCQVEVNATS